METSTTTTTTTTVDPVLEANRYRFGGFRGSNQGPSKSDSDQFIPEQAGYFDYPKEE